MILLFFSIWAIAIALNEVLFSAQPFSLSSIMSALPQTLIFSSLLSAAVYLAKSKILDAMHKGHPIDKKFVAEITPEVGHELNRMREKIEGSEGQQARGTWREGLQQGYADNNEEFNSIEYAQAQELFAKLSAAASQGQFDPEDPEFKLLLEKAKEQGLNIQDIVAIAADQSVPVFPDMNLPSGNEVADNKKSEDETNVDPLLNKAQDKNQPEIDVAQLAQSKQNIENLLAKYRNKTDDGIATLEQLAATPELSSEGLTPEVSPNNSRLTLENGQIQPIRAIDIKERNRQLAKEQNRSAQRRNAQLDALAKIASDEDRFIAQFRAAAEEGNQLARNRAMQAPVKGQAFQDASLDQSATAQVQTKTNALNTQSTNAQDSSLSNAPNTSSATGSAFLGQVSESTNQSAEGVDIYRPRFSRLEEQGANKEDELPDLYFSKDKSGTSPTNELFDGYEPQDQVVNDASIPDANLSSKANSKRAYSSRVRNTPRARMKDPDAPSLVDTSNLKKYQYVPPKKGAGLDLSALKKVTLPNYNRQNGPSRLVSTSALNSSVIVKSASYNSRNTTSSMSRGQNISQLKTRPKTVVGSNLSNAERQELMAKVKRNAQDKVTASRSDYKQPKWMQQAQEQKNQQRNKLESSSSFESQAQRNKERNVAALTQDLKLKRSDS